jgi:ketosteroid isomerase-like protein
MPPEETAARAAIEAGDVDALRDLLAEDVEFRSPAVYRPYRGRDTVIALLGVVAQVFEDFRYVHELHDGRFTVLWFETRVGDRELEGVDLLEEGDDGRIVRFTVMIRPLSGLQHLAATIQARLDSG